MEHVDKSYSYLKPKYNTQREGQRTSKRERNIYTQKYIFIEILLDIKSYSI